MIRLPPPRLTLRTLLAALLLALPAPAVADRSLAEFARSVGSYLEVASIFVAEVGGTVAALRTGDLVIREGADEAEIAEVTAALDELWFQLDGLSQAQSTLVVHNLTSYIGLYHLCSDDPGLCGGDRDAYLSENWQRVKADLRRIFKRIALLQDALDRIDTSLISADRRAALLTAENEATGMTMGQLLAMRGVMLDKLEAVPAPLTDEEIAVVTDVARDYRTLADALREALAAAGRPVKSGLQ